MRPIHLATLDKVRPAVVLTRAEVRPYLKSITIAPVTSTIRGLSTEVAVDEANGLDRPSVISCDNIITVPQTAIGRLLGYLHPDQEPALTRAIATAYDLEL